MQTVMLKSKIHRATVTDADIDYEGSITIDAKLMEAANILPYEKVGISNINNGERFDTYVISGEYNSGVICLNGPAARKVVKGDIVIIFSYAGYSEEELSTYKPIIVCVDKDNNIK